MKISISDREFQCKIPMTDKSNDVLKAFGLTQNRIKTFIYGCEFEINSGEICCISGASGSGKSLLLQDILRNINEKSPTDTIAVNSVLLTTCKSCVDCLDNDEGFLGCLRDLSGAGLTDVFTILNAPFYLSTGQQYRYKLAKAISDKTKKYIFADNFCDNLDRVTAAVISSNLRKIATKTGKVFFVASSHDDFFSELLPELFILKHLAGDTEIIYKNKKTEVYVKG
jgi:ABC-type ATPase with predicted acetyltransferase domain